jgi:hypothetical protein
VTDYTSEYGTVTQASRNPTLLRQQAKEYELSTTSTGNGPTAHISGSDIHHDSSSLLRTAPIMGRHDYLRQGGLADTEQEMLGLTRQLPNANLF